VSPVTAYAPKCFSTGFALIANWFGRCRMYFHMAIQIGFGRAQFATTVTLVWLGTVVFNFVRGQFVFIKKTCLARITEHAVHFFMSVFMILHTTLIRCTIVTRVARIRDARMFFFFVFLPCTHCFKAFITAITLICWVWMCIILMIF